MSICQYVNMGHATTLPCLPGGKGKCRQARNQHLGVEGLSTDLFTRAGGVLGRQVQWLTSGNCVMVSLSTSSSCSTASGPPTQGTDPHRCSSRDRVNTFVKFAVCGVQCGTNSGKLGGIDWTNLPSEGPKCNPRDLTWVNFSDNPRVLFIVFQTLG